MPFELTVPHETPAQPAPVTFQVTAALELPLTTAENCWRPLCAMVDSAGEIVIPMLSAVALATLAALNAISCD
jgi:hypothetical protein